MLFGDLKLVDDDPETRLWIRAGRVAQSFTLLGLMASACALIIFHT